tara:strand:+ start:814 stop:1299 length:486 start_codon:yes stop_codon:yes gene_type:complete
MRWSEIKEARGDFDSSINDYGQAVVAARNSKKKNSKHDYLILRSKKSGKFYVRAEQAYWTLQTNFRNDFEIVGQADDGDMNEQDDDGRDLKVKSVRGSQVDLQDPDDPAVTTTIDMNKAKNTNVSTDDRGETTISQGEDPGLLGNSQLRPGQKIKMKSQET